MTPELARIETVIEATWPPAATRACGPFCLRDGAGGGQRVSAATAEGEVTRADIEAAQTAMLEAGQAPLFRIREGDEALDSELAERGYVLRDETVIFSGPLTPIAAEGLPRGIAFAVWPPLAIMEEIWDDGAVGPARRDVMGRVGVARTGILARAEQRAAGVAFAAVHAGHVMVHAVHVAEGVRRQKTAYRMMVCAARWALDMGADRMTVLCLRHNLAAVSLYTSLGLEDVGRYHYRAKK